MSSDSFKNVINRMFKKHIYLIYMYKPNLTLNKCLKTKPNIHQFLFMVFF